MQNKTLILPSPAGLLEIHTGQKGVFRLSFLSQKEPPPQWKPPNTPLGRWLEDYREGGTRPFPWGGMDLQIGTPFEQKVWKILWEIPYGSVVSYGWVAKKLGMKGARAIGRANGKNPLPILIPCHRVISADGSLGGYSSGIEIKTKLLRHEGINL